MKTNIIGFWKPSGPYGQFSQWWINKSRNNSGYLVSYQFQDDTYKYICAEQYMMSQKALLFNDMETFNEIMKETDPSKMKKLGRKVRNFDSVLWDQCCQRIVYNGNYLKFTQNEYLKKLLLDTGDAKLAEASPYDRIWGIGVGIDDPDFYDESKWEGSNQLGNILMCLRGDIFKGTAKLLKIN